MTMHPNTQNTTAIPSTKEWVETEFASLDLGDKRLERRLMNVICDFIGLPNASIPQACKNAAGAKGAYRMFQNDSVDPDAVAAPHFQQTTQRAASHPVVLAIQDTTSLNFTTHPKTRGLGPIGNNASKTIGFHVHSSLAVTPEGLSLGLLNIHRWKRETREFKTKCAKRNRLPLEQKETYRWLEGYRVAQQLALDCPESLVVSVGDRENDIYEVFAEVNRLPRGQRAEVLIRAKHDRVICGEEQERLWQLVDNQPVMGHYSLQVRGKNGKPTRIARMEVRWSPLRLANRDGGEDLDLWIIDARETGAPEGIKPLHWKLLTSIPVRDLEHAKELIGWYSQRWQIEVFHKVLKSGCKVEQRQLETRERLERVLVVDMIVAWRILYLTRAAREEPEAPARQWLDEEEADVLEKYMEEKDGVAPGELTIRQAVRRIAQMGGFLGRKGDGEPGPITLWRGLMQFHAIVEAWTLAESRHRRQKDVGNA